MYDRGYIIHPVECACAQYNTVSCEQPIMAEEVQALMGADIFFLWVRGIQWSGAFAL